MMPDMAIKVIRGAGGTHFDKNITAAFVKNTQMYPPGFIVQLNTGECGIVIKYRNPENIRIRVFTDEKKKILTKFNEIELTAEGSLKILKTLEDIPQN